jgi:hypothetical protein
MKEIDGLFDNGDGDPLNDPKPRSKRVGQRGHVDDARHIGCPVWWLRLVFPIVRGKGELAAAIHKSKTISVPNGWLREHGIRRQAKYQMLEGLARAGIIRVRWDGKSALRVTFLSRR